MSPPGSSAATPALASPWRIASEVAGRGRGLLRRHWLFAVVAVCATALRVVVQLAYSPALIFPDSERYLQYAHNFLTGGWAPDWLRTSGYSLLLMPAVRAHNLAVVAAVQHVLGLATAALVYAVLVHFGAKRWLATLAAVPVLFDPLQLNIEQYILTDISATFLLVAALVVLVWKRDAMGRAAPIVAGLLLAAATIIRESDLIVIVPIVLYLVAVFRRRRRLAAKMVALLLLGFLPPVLGYLGWVDVWYGRFDFVNYDSQFLYGRIAQFIDCQGLTLPSYEQSLCPKQPPAQRNPDFYMWDPQSPQVLLQAPPGMNKGRIMQDFDRRILEHQPLAYLEAVGGDILYSFSPVRGDGPEHYPVLYHQFQTYFPGDGDYPGGKELLVTIPQYTGRAPHLEPALADFLAAYGRDFYVPGPLFAAGLVLGLAGMAGIGRARRSGLRAPCFLFAAGAIAAVESPFLIATFDWRYEIPQFSLIPIAAVLAVTAWTRKPSNLTPAPPPASTDMLVPVSEEVNPVPATRYGTDEPGDLADAHGTSDDQPGPASSVSAETSLPASAPGVSA
ncbi:MAG TPA: phospholipid carrier-dependent glycosyltransferase [Streptosporangiaceae bacterium]|nr:phospholipid carrier-dependent glycosyltransferase [Streptosporangiaceae bacterium]